MVFVAHQAVSLLEEALDFVEDVSHVGLMARLLGFSSKQLLVKQFSLAVCHFQSLH